MNVVSARTKNGWKWQIFMIILYSTAIPEGY